MKFLKSLLVRISTFVKNMFDTALGGAVSTVGCFGALAVFISTPVPALALLVITCAHVFILEITNSPLTVFLFSLAALIASVAVLTTFAAVPTWIIVVECVYAVKVFFTYGARTERMLDMDTLVSEEAEETAAAV